MTIESQLSPDGSQLTISISGRFDFSAHQTFRTIYESASPEVRSYCIDLKETTYLDSSALGMLLLLRDHAGGDSADVSVINCNSTVRNTLTMSDVGELFRLA